MESSPKIKDLVKEIEIVDYAPAEPKDGSVDVVSMVVPLFIRMMEFAREDAATDLDLHKVAERAAAEDGRILSMDDYERIVGEIDNTSCSDVESGDDELEEGASVMLNKKQANAIARELKKAGLDVVGMTKDGSSDSIKIKVKHNGKTFSIAAEGMENLPVLSHSDWKWHEVGSVLDVIDKIESLSESADELKEGGSMTVSELKRQHEDKNPESYYFSPDTLIFFGDRITNYGVRDAGENWELYRKKPVKNGLDASAYFDKETFKKVRGYRSNSR